MLIPNIPPYNPLDKAGNEEVLDREGVKKYPYTREETVTTQGDKMILSVWTDMSGQTVKTQISIQSDQ